MKIPLCFAFVICLAACSNKSYAPEGRPVQETAARAAGGQPAPSTKRFIATRHRITFDTPAEQLHQQFEAIHASCLKLGCVVLSSSQIHESPSAYAQAKLDARLPPAAFEGFLRDALSRANLLEHHRESDDKTAEVIDVEAKIANLTALKARVLELLAKRTADLKETLEAEKQLAETQSALDSIQGVRKALANETDMVRVEITLQAKTLRTRRSWLAPIGDAIDESGNILASSLGALISFVVALLPWVLVLAYPAIWLVRRWRNRKKTALPPTV